MKSHIDKFIIIDKLSDLNKRNMILGHHITCNIICSKLGVHRSLPFRKYVEANFQGTDNSQAGKEEAEGPSEHKKQYMHRTHVGEENGS